MEANQILISTVASHDISCLWIQEHQMSSAVRSKVVEFLMGVIGDASGDNFDFRTQSDSRHRNLYFVTHKGLDTLWISSRGRV